jgi:DNA-binding GntR family transcriptional regulator
VAPSPFVRPRSLAEQAAEQIRRLIVKGDLQLGEALSETALATALGVSKTPIREALLRLKTEGLVDIQPQRGTFVFRMGADEVRTLSEFRDVLEISALRLGMRRDARALGRTLKRIVADMNASLADDDAARYREQDGLFHECIIESCANHHLTRSYTTIAFRVQALRNRLSANPHLNAQSFKQHRMLAQLIAGGQTAKAASLLKKHIAQTLEDYENTLGSGARRLTAQNAFVGIAQDP